MSEDKHVCRLMAFGQDPLQAVAGPRLHHQLLPDFVGAEHWNVSNATGPSFMVSNAEVQVRSCATRSFSAAVPTVCTRRSFCIAIAMLSSNI